MFRPRDGGRFGFAVPHMATNCGVTSSLAVSLASALSPEAFMVTLQHYIRTVMLSTDAKIIKLWVGNQPSSHTRWCYRHDSEQLLNHAKKPLSRITLADLQSFAQALTARGLAPISHVRTLAAVKSLFGFCSGCGTWLSVRPRNWCCPATRIAWRNGFSLRKLFNGSSPPKQNHVIAFFCGCSMPAACACRKPATCSCAIFMLEATPARLRYSERTAGRGRFPCPRSFGRN